MEFILREYPFKLNEENFKYRNLFRKTLYVCDKDLIVAVVKDCLERSIGGEETEILTMIKKLYENNKKFTFNDLMQTFKTENVTVLLMHLVLLAFETGDIDIMLQLYYTYGFISPSQNRNEWTNTLNLNALLYILTLTKYRKDDTFYTYSVIVKEPLQPIDKTKIIDFSRVKKFLIGDLKSFIIKNRICPFYAANAVEKPDTDITDEQICDDCYEHFPFYSGGVHMCDAFYDGKTLTISEIRDFLNRYPSATLGYILNTQPLTAGNGKHWVALIFTEDLAVLICSAGGNFEQFEDGNRLRNDLETYGFGLVYNQICIQNDDNNCGLFSVLSLIMFIYSYCKNYNAESALKSAVELIGENATKIKHGDIFSLRDKLLGKKML
jgi:hypothetical protein